MPEVRSNTEVKAKPAAKAAVKAKPVAKPKAAAKPKAETKPKTATKPKTVVEAKAATKSKTPAKPKVEAAPKPRSRKVTTATIGPEERYQMIAEAAYFRAQKRGFSLGDTAQDWLEAEAEINRMLEAPRSKIKAASVTAKQVFQQKLETQIQDWDSKLAELKARAQGASASLKSDYEKQFAVLTEKRNVAQARMQELRSRAEDVWEDLKGGTEKAWDDMHKALDQISARFK